MISHHHRRPSSSPRAPENRAAVSAASPPPSSPVRTRSATLAPPRGSVPAGALSRPRPSSMKPRAAALESAASPPPTPARRPESQAAAPARCRKARRQHQQVSTRKRWAKARQAIALLPISHAREYAVRIRSQPPRTAHRLSLQPRHLRAAASSPLHAPRSRRAPSTQQNRPQHFVAVSAVLSGNRHKTVSTSRGDGPGDGPRQRAPRRTDR